jgi:hypothetical protein
MEKWEFQRQDTSGNWQTMHNSSYPQNDQMIKIALDNLERSNPGKRVRALCNGRVVDIR